MSARLLKIVPIVEGDGEVAAVPILLRRICDELFDHAVAHVLQPVRQPRSRLVSNREDCLQKSLGLAVNKLRQLQIAEARELVLLLLDADEDCPAELAPRLNAMAAQFRSDADFACVLAMVEFETWFVASAESLTRFIQLDRPDEAPRQPERTRSRKAWIQNRFLLPKYSETVDQPKLTAAMDLALCRSRSASFDKLCRELGRRLE
jgi:hypothetical protein